MDRYLTGAAIRRLRESKKMRQEDLAGRLNLRRQTVSRYELGNLDLDTDTIRQICRIFDCSADYLLGLSSRRRPEISDDDADLLAAYKRAPDSVRAGIDALLEPYKKKKDAEGL